MMVFTWLHCLELPRCVKIIWMSELTIFDYKKEKLLEEFAINGFKSYKVKQLYNWLYQRKVNSFMDMSDLSKDFRMYLNENYPLRFLRLIKRLDSEDGTIKLVFACEDDELVETVIMRHDYGNSVCVSSQIGCLMGCLFCASGLLKKVRDLTSGEMVLQVLQAEIEIGERIDNVVVMGSGEPFDNYDKVIEFLDIINDDWGLAIGARHISVSTCGIIPRILDFAHEKPYNLAVSLHSAILEKRERLMPITRKYPLEKLKEALKSYIEIRNRRVSLEYILFRGINDQREDVKALRDFVKGLKNVYVNLIPYNSVEEYKLKGVSEIEALKFYNELKEKHVAVTLRNRYGDDIDAACGQLRNRLIKGEGN